MTGEEALKRLSKQYKRQNEFIRESRDRITIVFPKGTKDRIRAHGESINGLVNRLVLGWLDDKDGEVQQQDDLPDYDFFADEDH